MQKLTLLFTIIISLISTCTSAETPSREHSNVLFPLKVGNNWQFVDEDGDIHYAAIQGEINIGENTWYEYRELSDEDIFYINNSAKGQIEIDLETKEQSLVLPYPLDNKKTYIQYGVKSSVTPNVKVTVKAGTFNTYKYEFSVDEPSDPIILWIAPGIGPVKNIYKNKTYELIEFNLQ